MMLEAQIILNGKLQNVTNELNEIVKYVEENNLYNTQEYLDFEDYLNRISVRDHTLNISK